MERDTQCSTASIIRGSCPLHENPDKPNKRVSTVPQVPRYLHVVIGKNIVLVAFLQLLVRVLVRIELVDLPTKPLGDVLATCG